MAHYRYRRIPLIRTTGTTQPYMNYMAIIMPLLLLTLSISLVSFQLLHFSFVRAQTVHPAAMLPGTLPPLLTESKFVRTADPQQRITLSIGLRPRNIAFLQQAVEVFSHPDATLHHMHSMSSAYYTQQFSPTAGFYLRIKHYLSQAGFVITRSYTHRLLLDFRGTVAQAERLFHVHINTYSTPDGLLFFSNTTDPQIPDWLAGQITGINGLNSASHWQHTSIQAQLPLTSWPRDTIMLPACPFSSLQKQASMHLAHNNPLNDLYRAHYGGEGQNIALFELAAYPGISASTSVMPAHAEPAPLVEHDLTTYQGCLGLQRTHLQMYLTMPDAASLSAMATRETIADADILLNALPQLHALNIYATDNDETHYLSQWAQIIQDATPIVATNWGLCEQRMPLQLAQQEYYLFQLAALQGQNILASTGAGCSNADTTMTSRRTIDTGVMDPAAQPFVTAVSGITQSPRYAPPMPTTLSGRDQRPIDGSVSRYWLMPDWQHISNIPGIPDGRSKAVRLCRAPNHMQAYCRAVPDVSLFTASSLTYWMYCSHTTQCDPLHPWTRIGGPTVAVPLWAAFLALTDEMSQRQGMHPGFLTPLLYRIASDPVAYTASFHDIIGQTQDWAAQSFANTGYDSATGLGSYNAGMLAQHVISLLPQSKRPVQQRALDIHSHSEQ